MSQPMTHPRPLVLESFDWDAFCGEGGSWLRQVIDEYDLGTGHQVVKGIIISFDFAMCGLESVCLLLRYGDVAGARAGWAKVLDAHKQAAPAGGEVDLAAARDRVVAIDAPEGDIVARVDDPVRLLSGRTPSIARPSNTAGESKGESSQQKQVAPPRGPASGRASSSWPIEAAAAKPAGEEVGPSGMSEHVHGPFDSRDAKATRL